MNIVFVARLQLYTFCIPDMLTCLYIYLPKNTKTPVLKNKIKSSTHTNAFLIFKLRKYHKCISFLKILFACNFF